MAAYALHYSDHQVYLVERDDRVFAIWAFLLGQDADAYIREIPDRVKVGDRISAMFPSDQYPEGFIEILRAECNHGTQGATGIHDQITKIGAHGWHRIKQRLHYWLPRIKHWKVIRGSYEAAPDVEATWFIDPPYNNPAGARYRCHDLDYQRLARWCRSRRGQTIVCENMGASWLPFQPLGRRRGIRSAYQVSNAVEAIWVKSSA